MMKKCKPDCLRCGKGRQRCSYGRCAHWSLRGHYKGRGLCAYHWNVVSYGRAWADLCELEQRP